jgi:hypothetical protein
MVILSDSNIRVINSLRLNVLSNRWRQRVRV